MNHISHRECLALITRERITGLSFKYGIMPSMVPIISRFWLMPLFHHCICSIGSNVYVRCRLRGKLDSNGVIAAFLEERLNMGVNFILSAEVDHRKKDYKFGFGMTVGE